MNSCKSAIGSGMIEQPHIDLSLDNWRIVRGILLGQVPGREVWAFGSRARRTAKEFSDLDLAVVGEERMSVSHMASLREAFQESGLPFKVDIVDWVATDERFREIIRQDRVVLQRQ